MDLGILKTLQNIGSQAFNKHIPLNFGSTLRNINKESLNRLVSENILRKSTQLVNDLLKIRALKAGKNETPLPPPQEDAISKSVQEILDLRETLGITPDQGPSVEALKNILDHKRGSILDQKT